VSFPRGKKEGRGSKRRRVQEQVKGVAVRTRVVGSIQSAMPRITHDEALKIHEDGICPECGSTFIGLQYCEKCDIDWTPQEIRKVFDN
jgi:hypothetical protein